MITNMRLAKEYARRTMAFGGFNRPSPSGSDLYQTLYTLKRGDSMFGKERDAMLMDKVRIPEPQIKRFPNQVKNGQVNQSQMQQFLFKLERDPQNTRSKIKSNKKISAKLA